MSEKDGHWYSTTNGHGREKWTIRIDRDNYGLIETRDGFDGHVPPGRYAIVPESWLDMDMNGEASRRVTEPTPDRGELTDG